MARYSDAAADEAGSYGVTTWTGKIGSVDAVLTATPLTPNDYSHAARRTKNPNFAQAPTTEGMVELLIRKCRDDKGADAFTLVDKPAMMKWKASLIGDIFFALFGEGDADSDDKIEDAIKN